MKLLVGMDGSEEAERALARAITIADATDGELTIAYAVDPAAYDAGGSEPIETAADADERLIVESTEAAEDRGLDVLEDAATVAADRGHDAETELLYGDPATVLTEYADDEGFDAIYVGHRGLSERAETLLGSVANTIVEQSTVPVTVVR